MPNDQSVSAAGAGGPALLTNNGQYPIYTEATRSGNGWTFISTTALTEVAAVPTTVAGLEIFNNMAGTNTSMLVDGLFAFQLLGTAASQAAAIWAMVTTQKAAPTNTALSYFSVSGRAAKTTVAGGPYLTIQGSTVVANGWRAWGMPAQWGTNTATPGLSLTADVMGRLIVPPGASLCITVAGSLATASSWQVGATIYEAQITNVA